MAAFRPRSPVPYVLLLMAGSLAILGSWLDGYGAVDGYKALQTANAALLYVAAAAAITGGLIGLLTRWIRVGRIVACASASVIAIPAGIGAWQLRNRLSDDASYKAAARSGKPADLQLYLKGNGRHAERVRTRDLPRAELDAVSRTGSVRLLRQFIAEPANAALAGEARALIASRFSQAREQSRRSTGGNTRLQSYLLHLLDLVWKDDAPIHVRYARPDTSALEQLVTPPRLGIGSPLQQLDLRVQKGWRRHERRITDELGLALARCIGSHDLLRVTHAGRTTKLPSGPNIDIRYAIRPSSSVYQVRGKPGSYGGLQLELVAQFRIDGPVAYEARLTARPPEKYRFQVLRMLPAVSVKLYQKMVDAIFDDLPAQLSTQLACRGK